MADFHDGRTPADAPPPNCEDATDALVARIQEFIRLHFPNARTVRFEVVGHAGEGLLTMVLTAADPAGRGC